jgi:hypothetical protein
MTYGCAEGEDIVFPRAQTWILWNSIQNDYRRRLDECSEKFRSVIAIAAIRRYDDCLQSSQQLFQPTGHYFLLALLSFAVLCWLLVANAMHVFMRMSWGCWVITRIWDGFNKRRCYTVLLLVLITRFNYTQFHFYRVFIRNDPKVNFRNNPDTGERYFRIAPLFYRLLIKLR